MAVTVGRLIHGSKPLSSILEGEDRWFSIVEERFRVSERRAELRSVLENDLVSVWSLSQEIEGSLRLGGK